MGPGEIGEQESNATGRSQQLNALKTGMGEIRRAEPEVREKPRMLLKIFSVRIVRCSHH